jgi:two-component sensor histidine kinase
VASGAGGGVPLHDLIEGELSTFGPHVSVECNALVPTPRFAQRFALLLHELASNAVAHGSLSIPQGRVQIRDIADREEPVLLFQWKECNGPPVEPPKQERFGLTHINAVMSRAVRVSFAKSGFALSIELSLSEV